jgi:hypothetical protein
MRLNPCEGLPIGRSCDADYHVDEDAVRRTASDDRAFRLTRLPVSAAPRPRREDD